MTESNTRKVSYDAFSFSMALSLLKQGKRVSRYSWSPTAKTFIFLVDGSRFAVNRPPLLGIYTAGTMISYRPHIDQQREDGTIGVWSASCDDMLAEDWFEVNDGAV